jgi:microcystin-dependent protein
MPYTVNFTDSNNKTPITVFDNTSNTDTSLKFPGRNVTGYGQIIAENFLSLLENFANAEEPVNPIEGQLWYDSTNGVLNVWDDTNWKAASGIQKGPTEPAVPDSKVGELWVDTTNQQLRIFTGQRWILVGPSESSVDGLRYGPSVEKIADSDNIDRFILTLYIADVPVIIVSKDSFTPKIIIPGFTVIRSGVNVASVKDPDGNIVPALANQFSGGFLPTLFGSASTADALNVPGEALPVDAGKFLRSNSVNTTEFAFNIRNNSGLTLGVDGTFNLSNTSTSARIYNSVPGSSLDLQTNRNGIASTILRVIDNRVGINKASPDQALDVDGNIGLSGSLIVSNTTASTNLNNGSIRTLGGVSISKNLLVGDGGDITGVLTTNNIQPKVTDLYDCGTELRRWNTVRAKTIIAESIQGVLDGSISGNANTATNLKNVTSFQLNGDVVSQAVQFDGQVGSYTKIFNTELTANIIAGKDDPDDNVSKKTDYILTYRASEASTESSGLLKQTRDTFVGDLGVPIGSILPFAGSVVPYGYLLCDGSEVERTKFEDLYDIISTTYNGTSALVGVGTFRLPDLRGRFPLGKDNMDNNGEIPLPTGGYVDSGGGTANRVPDIKAQQLGGDAGQSSVTLTLANLPEHSHTLNSGRQAYAAIAVTTVIDAGAETGLGPTAPGQAQYLRDSGGITKPSSVSLSTPVGTMNPYLTINYIIRSGPPAF